MRPHDGRAVLTSERPAKTDRLSYQRPCENLRLVAANDRFQSTADINHNDHRCGKAELKLTSEHCPRILADCLVKVSCDCGVSFGREMQNKFNRILSSSPMSFVPTECRESRSYFCLKHPKVFQRKLSNFFAAQSVACVSSRKCDQDIGSLI